MRVGSLLAATASLLLTSGCTPNKVLKSGPVVSQARALALRFCAAAVTEDRSDERELFSSELIAAVNDPAVADQANASRLTSADPFAMCHPGRVRGFGFHLDNLEISVEVKLSGATDKLVLSRAEPGRIEDIVYDQGRRLGPHDGWSLRSNLQHLRYLAERRQRDAAGRKGATMDPRQAQGGWRTAERVLSPVW
jgi:hypothetical protein